MITPHANREPITAAALVISHPPLRVVPMYAGLVSQERAITDIRLLPVQAVDFYARRDGK